LTPQGKARPLLSNLWSGELLVTPDGKEVIYTDGSWDEGVGLWRMRLSPGAKPQLIHGSADRYFTPAISRDGRRLAFAVNRVYHEDIWKLPLSGPHIEPT